MTDNDTRFYSQVLVVFSTIYHINFQPILVLNACYLLQYDYLVAWDRFCYTWTLGHLVTLIFQIRSFIINTNISVHADTNEQ